MPHCQCLYEIENNLPRTQHCFMPCSDQYEILRERERMNPPKREFSTVLKNILSLIPSDKEQFIEDIKWNLEDGFYKAPEETLHWERTTKTLMKHIPKPTEDWEFQILNLFTTRPIEELHKMFEFTSK